MSRRITVTLPDDVDEELPYDEFDSKSATVVEYVRRGMELEEVREELELAEARADDLRRQLREANRRNDEVTELVEYVETEKSLVEKREERRSAPAWRRAKWWLFGRDE